MARPKSKLTKEQLLERRAQAAWEYRQRAAVNEKARLRMRARRERLRRAPADVQSEYAVRAARYRRDYVERTRRAVTSAALHSLSRTKSPHANRAPPCAPRQRPRSPDDDGSWEEWEDGDAAQRRGVRDDLEEQDESELEEGHSRTRIQYYRTGNITFID
ncbi:hypothetical protein R3P38DRAFT_3185520 [Favolaschia claudopus]|uniref:Uncharacterized protein n=1 Tax=Favolaschia claudopus TaxID=2862362 RepID=A0AAW0C498_9AGAR